MIVELMEINLPPDGSSLREGFSADEAIFTARITPYDRLPACSRQASMTNFLEAVNDSLMNFFY
jgi:hypothetical protein